MTASTPPLNLLLPQVSALLIRSAQLLDGRQVDVRINGGKIVALAPSLIVEANEQIINAHGGLLLPGLHDHHLHLFATAAARNSIVCGPPAVTDQNSLRQVLQQAASVGDGWLRGTGFHDSVCDNMNRDWLDCVCAERPLRIQHRSGMLWVLNSAAINRVQLASDEQWPAGAERDAEGRLTGRCYAMDQWLGQHLGVEQSHRQQRQTQTTEQSQRRWPSLQKLSAELARFGITAVTDTGVNNGADELQAFHAALSNGELRQRLLLMGSEALTDAVSPLPEWMAIGPLKLYLREFDLPELDEFAERIATAHQHGRAVAIHCVTRTELYVALAALEQAGVLRGDRIEHASVADDYALETLARLGVVVVSQPQFIAERGDQYRCDVEADDVPLLYRARSFITAGVAFAGSSDAPYGDINPWAAMRAAQQRCTLQGMVMGADETLTPLQALALYGGDPFAPASGLRQLAVGQVADLCLLAVPWSTLTQDFDARHVRLTICAGHIIYQSDLTAEAVELSC